MNTQLLSEFKIENNHRSVYIQLKAFGTFLHRDKAKYYEKCQIIATDSKIIFRIPGSEFYIPAQPINKLIIEVYYTDLKDAFENERSPELTFQVYENTLVINNRKLSCSVKKLKDNDFNLEAGLGALNFGETNNGTPSWQMEAYIINTSRTEVHINTINKDAQSAAILLKKYNISGDDIVRLIMEKVH
jgi:hypothetical protein